MSEQETSKPQTLKTTPKERLTAFYEWCATHDFTLKDMEAILVGVILQANIQGFKDEITVANRTFEIIARELLPKEEKAQETKEEGKNNA